MTIYQADSLTCEETKELLKVCCYQYSFNLFCGSQQTKCMVNALFFLHYNTIKEVQIRFV